MPDVKGFLEAGAVAQAAIGRAVNLIELPPGSSVRIYGDDFIATIRRRVPRKRKAGCDDG